MYLYFLLFLHVCHTVYCMCSLRKRVGNDLVNVHNGESVNMVYRYIIFVICNTKHSQPLRITSKFIHDVVLLSNTMTEYKFLYLFQILS